MMDETFIDGDRRPTPGAVETKARLPIAAMDNLAAGKDARKLVLWVAATESFIPKWLAAHPEGEAATDALSAVRARMAHIPQATLASVSEAGHMLHLDRPEAVARMAAFMSSVIVALSVIGL